MAAAAEGLARLKAGDLAGAVDALQQASVDAPDDPQIPLALGVALQRAARHEEALAAFQRAEALRAQDAAAPLHAALSALALGRVDEAVAASERACRLAPGLAAAQVMRGRALLAHDEPAAAAGALAEALRLAPNSAEAWRLQADALRRAGDGGGATVAQAQAERLSPRASLKAWRPTSPAAALGLAVEYLSRKPAFAALPFGEWSQVLFYQVARGHYLFIVDDAQHIQGFIGWALTDQAFADAWVEGRAGLRNDSADEGDCAIINAWAAEDWRANGALRAAVVRLFADRRAVYFKRHYADGRQRAMRLSTPAHRRNAL